MTKWTKSEWKRFLKLLAAIAIPVAFQNLLTTTGSMVDTLMLARLGENTVAAIGLCAQFASLMFSCYWGFVGGGVLFESQHWGAKDGAGVCRSHGMTMACLIIVALVFCGMAFFAPQLVMKMYTDKGELWEIGVRYLRIVGFAYLLQNLSVGFSTLLRSTERVRIPLIASITSLIVNMAFNYVLIFGKLGFPKLGVEGAAIATLIAAAVNLAMLVLLGGLTHHPYILKFRDHFRWKRVHVKEFLIKCFPIICNELLIGVGNAVINIVLGRQATTAIAALAVFRTFEGFVISFFVGFTSAASILVGKEVGAGNHDLAYERARRLVILVPCVVLTMCLLFLLVLEPFLSAMNLTGEAHDYCRTMITIFSFIVTIRMTNWIHNDTFRSAGDPIFGTVLEITFMYLMVLPAICLSGLVFKAPFIVVWFCAYCDEPVRIFIIARHLISGKWIRPVTEEGLKTIDAFREKHGIRVKAKKAV